MNAIPLLELALAMAPLMPSAVAAPHASLEWRLARAQWLAALRELNLTEEKARDLSSRRRLLEECAKSGVLQ